jgi:Flp pilus assembly protein TadG
MKHINKLMQRACFFTRDAKGTAIIEFAIAVPVLLTLLYGAIEVNRYITMLQKVDKSAYTIADVMTRRPGALTQNPDPSQSWADVEYAEAAMDLYGRLMRPYSEETSDGEYSVGSEGIVAITSVYKDRTPVPGNPPRVMWQITGGGTLSGGNLISDITGQPISNAPTRRCTAPNFAGPVQDALDLTGGMRSPENMIVVEVFYRYQPLFGTTFFNLGETIFKRNAFFTPRITSAPPIVNLIPDFCCYDYTLDITEECPN